MAIIYRLEVKDESFNDAEDVNLGVYRNYNTDRGIGSACDGFYDGASNYLDKHPTPSRDPRLSNHAVARLHVFAFTSASQLHRWFSNIPNVDQDVLNKIQISIYYVPDEHYIKGTFQAVANRLHMTRIDTWEPTRRG